MSEANRKSELWKRYKCGADRMKRKRERERERSRRGVFTDRWMDNVLMTQDPPGDTAV